LSIVAWAAVGSLAALIGHLTLIRRFPAGAPGAAAAGAIGGFLGGALVTVILGRMSARLDPASVAGAVLVGTLLVPVVSRAAYPHRSHHPSEL
jgi:hypothetical protein